MNIFRKTGEKVFISIAKLIFFTLNCFKLFKVSFLYYFQELKELNYSNFYLYSGKFKYLITFL